MYSTTNRVAPPQFHPHGLRALVPAALLLTLRAHPPLRALMPALHAAVLATIEADQRRLKPARRRPTGLQPAVSRTVSREVTV